jgi:dienelactone hydrolase
MHILDGNMELVRMQCTVLATHGIPAILFMLPYYGQRGLPEGPGALAANPSLFVDALLQGMEDVRRTIDLLASRPEIDPKRIGITGISLGGIVAATAAGSEPRLARVMPILAGGDLLAIIRHARETEDLNRLLQRLPAQQRSKIEAAIQAVDPLRHAGALRDRAQRGRVLMVNAAEDEVIPRACTEKLAAALGLSERVEWLDGLGHYTAMAALPRVMQRMVDFFGQDLPAGVKVPAPSADGKTPAQVVLCLLKDAVGFFTAEPEGGRCHFADLLVEFAPAGQKPYQGRILLIRGTGGRFKLECRLPVIGEVAIGQGNQPWMVSTQKTLFRGGTSGQTRLPDPLAFAQADHLLRLRMVAGALAGAVLAPDILDPLAAIADEPTGNGQRVIRVDLKGQQRGTFRLALSPDGKTPQLLSFAVPGAAGKVTFRNWQVDAPAPEALFEPPAGLPSKEVETEDLQRMFSAMFDFAMEKIE